MSLIKTTIEVLIKLEFNGYLGKANVTCEEIKALETNVRPEYQVLKLRLTLSFNSPVVSLT
jgi:hypothetical protein